MTFPRIVALDMDGTLVDPAGNIPDEFWPVLEDAKRKGMVIAPASGRQLATLQDMFDGKGLETFIAENGSAVWHKGEIVSTKPMDEDVVRTVLTAAAESDAPIHPVLCKPEYALIASDLPDAVLSEISKYYHSRRPVSSLLEAAKTSEDPTIKVSFFVETNAEEDGLQVAQSAVGQNIAVSGANWVDIMSPETNKGFALRALADTLHVDIADTAAIGDYLNDYEMLQTADTAVAMANGHDKLKAIADIIAASNAEHGALKMIREWLDQG